MPDAFQVLAPTDDDVKAMEAPVETPAEPTVAPVTPPATDIPTAPVTPPVIPPVVPQAGPPKDTPEQQIEKLNAALREARTEMKSFRERASKIDEIKTTIEAWQREKEIAAKPPVPDFDSDPIGHQQAMLKQIQENQQALATQTQNLGQQNQFQQLVNTVQTYENDFRRAKPDYDAAQKFVLDMRRKELELFGVTDEQQIAADLGQNAYSLSMSALQNGKNPAELVYSIAVQRGYKPTATVSAPAPVAVQQQQAALDSIQKGQAAATTLSNKGSAEIAPTLQAVLDAPVGSSEFDSAWKAYFGLK